MSMSIAWYTGAWLEANCTMHRCTPAKAGKGVELERGGSNSFMNPNSHHVLIHSMGECTIMQVSNHASTKPHVAVAVIPRKEAGRGRCESGYCFR